MVDGSIGEHGLDGRVSLAGLGQSGVDHHSLRVESPQRKNPAIERRRHLVVIDRCLFRRLAYEDRMAGPIGIIALVREVIDEQERLACLGIVQLDAAWKGGPAVGNHPDGTMCGKFLVAEAKEVGELVRVDP